MAKFRKESDPGQVAKFIQADEERREANAQFDDPVLCCPRCGYTCKKSYAVDHALSRCPQCGTAEAARVMNLPYDPALQRTHKPSYQDALKTERANLPGRVG